MTAAKEAARLAIPLHVRSIVLNHSPQTRGVTDAAYNRYAYDKKNREALALWQTELIRLTTAAPASEPDSA